MAAGGAELTAAVHVEALANDGASETVWAHEQIKSSPFPIFVVGYVDLSAEDASAQLKAMREKHGDASLRGIRQILNYEPTWPKVGSGAYLTDAAWQRGYAALESVGLSFDMQLNPHQLQDAASLVAKFPQIPVIVNHMATLKLGAEGKDDEAEIATWRAGMCALKEASEHVYIKLSMLCYTDPDWDRAGSRVPGLVKECVDLFGTERCMFASNYCVDKADKWHPERLFKGFAMLCDHMKLSEEQRAHLYEGTARRAYRM